MLKSGFQHIIAQLLIHTLSETIFRSYLYVCTCVSFDIQQHTEVIFIENNCQTYSNKQSSLNIFPHLITIYHSHDKNLHKTKTLSNMHYHILITLLCIKHWHIYVQNGQNINLTVVDSIFFVGLKKTAFYYAGLLLSRLR